MTDLLHETRGQGIREVMRMSWPACVTMLNVTLMRFVDGLMVSEVSAEAFSAQYVGGMTAFVPESFLVGALTVVNTYVGQNFGAGRFGRTASYAWSGLLLAAIGAVLMIPLAIFAPLIFGLAPLGETVQDYTVLYFRYMIITVGFTIGARVLEQFFYGVHRPRTVLLISLLANGLNVLLNLVLIFGYLGFPAMGLEGAAIGTVTSWIVQFGLLMVLFLSPRMRRKCKTHLWKAAKWRHSMDLLRTGWPAGMQLCNDIFSWAIFTTAIVSIFGTAHLTATTVAMRYMGLSFMPAVGIGIATTAMVGKAIGENDPHTARKRTHMALIIATIYMAVCGLLFLLFRYPMSELFVTYVPMEEGSTVDPRKVVDIATTILLLAALFQMLNGVAIVYIGALRGAGDTIWPMGATLVLTWTIVIGGGVLTVWLLPELKSLGPWLAGSIYVAVLGAAMAWRFETGKWKTIDLLTRRRGESIDIDEPFGVA